MRRLTRIPFIFVALTLVVSCAAWAQKKTAAPAAAPVTTLVAIDETNRDALSGQESVRLITFRSDDTVTVLALRGGAAVVPDSARTPVPLRTEHAAELKALLQASELARLGDLESPAPA